MRSFKYIIVGIVLSIMVAACGVGPDKSREDARDTQNVNKTSPAVIAFNNHYPNVETKCAAGTGYRIFVTTHDSAVGRNVIVVPDPKCGGKVPVDPDSYGTGKVGEDVSYGTGHAA